MIFILVANCTLPGSQKYLPSRLGLWYCVFMQLILQSDGLRYDKTFKFVEVRR